LVTVATIVSVNVRAQQNANCLHVNFRSDPTAVASQRHERLFSRTPTESGKRERTAIGTLSDNAIAEPRNLDRPTATVTLCRTRNDSATKEFDRNGFRVTVRALETRSDFCGDLTLLCCCAKLLFGEHFCNLL
jgi:hypothetical protein